LATEVIMPALSPGQETGILLEWFKQEGETIEKGEPLMEVETDRNNRKRRTLDGSRNR